MRKAILVLVLSILIMNVTAVSAAEPYLRAHSKIDRTVVKPGDPIVAVLTLNRTGIIPESASINYTTDLTSPDLKVIIDGGDPIRLGLQEDTFNLPLDGVDTIEITITGNVPDVETQTTISVIELSTLVNYKGEEPEYQDTGKVLVTVSTAEISTTKGAVNDAKSKYARVQDLLDSLEEDSIDVIDLKAELADAKVQIDTADELFAKGDQDLAKQNAESAINALNRIEEDANARNVGVEQKSDIKKYLVIGAAVVIVAIVFLVIKSKREELG